jgi:hypothetical protein
MMKANTYERNGEWAGYSVKASKTGWVVETWSRIEGNITDTKTLVPYGASFPQDMELNAKWNDTMTNGDAIYAIGTFRDATGNPYNAKTLRKGHVVR